MKFTCLQENLSSKLSTVNRAVAVRGSLSILSNILISAEKSRLNLSATNLQLSISTWVGASVEEEGSLTVPGSVLTSFITALSPQKLHFESKKNILRIETEHGWAQINCASSEDFPQIGSVPGKTLIQLPASELKKALSGVIFAAAADEGRPILTGVLFTAEKDSTSLSLVGVDGFRLAESTLDLENPLRAPLKVVIPARTLSELIRLLGEQESVKMELKDKENEVLFDVNETLMYSRLLEGEFPNYKQILPTDFKVEAVVPLEDFRKAIQLSSIFAQESSNVIKLKLSPSDGRVTISANTQEVGDNVTHVDGTVTGEEEEIAFNTRYLNDVLGYLPGEQLRLSIQDSLSPGMIKPVDSESYIHIIMPVRLQEE